MFRTRLGESVPRISRTQSRHIVAVSCPTGSAPKRGVMWFLNWSRLSTTVEPARFGFAARKMSHFRASSAIGFVADGSEPSALRCASHVRASRSADASSTWKPRLCCFQMPGSG
jgi:hypothetical protein